MINALKRPVGLNMNGLGEVSRKVEEGWWDIDDLGELEPFEAEFMELANVLQERFNTGRLKVVVVDGLLRAETEFFIHSDEPDLLELKGDLLEGGHRIDQEILDEDREVLDHYSPGNGIPREGYRPDPDKPGWFFGPDHGRVGSQYSLFIELTHEPDRRLLELEVAEAVAILLTETTELWRKSGVNVI